MTSVTRYKNRRNPPRRGGFGYRKGLKKKRL